MLASQIRKSRVRQLSVYRNWRRHVDEVFERTNGKHHYLGRAVDHEGEIF